MVVAAMANSGCCLLIMPDEEIRRSDRHRMTSSGLDILTIKCRLTPVGLGVLMVKGLTTQVALGILLHFGENLTATSFILLLSNTALHLAC